MAHISEGSQNRFEELRNDIEQSLEEMIASNDKEQQEYQAKSKQLDADFKKKLTQIPHSPF